MCNSLSEPLMSVSHVMTRIHAWREFFWQVTSSLISIQMYYGKLALRQKICFIWKNRLICIYLEISRTTGQLLFILRNVFLKSPFIWQNNAFPYLIPYKFLHVYSPEICACGCKSVRQEIPRVAHLCILLWQCRRNPGTIARAPI